MYSLRLSLYLYCRFEAFQAPRAGFLTVLEELPGLVHHEDVTNTLVVSCDVVVSVVCSVQQSTAYFSNHYWFAHCVLRCRKLCSRCAAPSGVEY
jgi:hypothetical protein